MVPCFFLFFLNSFASDISSVFRVPFSVFCWNNQIAFYSLFQEEVFFLQGWVNCALNLNFFFLNMWKFRNQSLGRPECFFYPPVLLVCLLNQKYKRQKEKTQKVSANKELFYFSVKPCVLAGGWGGGQAGTGSTVMCDWLSNTYVRALVLVCKCLSVCLCNCADAYGIMHMC